MSDPNSSQKDGFSSDSTEIDGTSLQSESSAEDTSITSERSDLSLVEMRTHNLWDFKKVAGKKVSGVSALPFPRQQVMILSQLLHCFTGVLVPLIEPTPPDSADGGGPAQYKTKFEIHSGVDSSSGQLLQEILPLASHFVGIQQMVANMEGQGQVINALNGALKDISHAFFVLLGRAEVELEKKELTIQKLVYYMQPTMCLMGELWQTLVDLQQGKLHGAAVLSHLYGRIGSLEGDSEAQKIFIQLVQETAKPYMKFLQRWIQYGVIADREKEFCVQEHTLGVSFFDEHYPDEFWKNRFSLNYEQIPSFLEVHADKILRTGKYLNVVLQCGNRRMPVQKMQLEFNPTSVQHVSVINEAYYFAARLLLDVLLKENDLMGHLRSVRRYFLLYQGDFITEFMDAAEGELSKKVNQVLPGKLESLLDITLGFSAARCDPHKDLLHCNLLDYDLVTQLTMIMHIEEEQGQTQERPTNTGLECFAFTYHVEWPINLVISLRILSQYELIFRQLFYLKHVERNLCKISFVKKFWSLAPKHHSLAITLPQRMMNAIQNLEYYMMMEVIEPNWHTFIEKMRTVTSIDHVMLLHQDLVDACLKNCLLSSTPCLTHDIFELFKVCLKFCDLIEPLVSSDAVSSDAVSSDAVSSDAVSSDAVSLDTFWEQVKRLDVEFTGILISFLKKIAILGKENPTDSFTNLVHRINFSGFYNDLIYEKPNMKAPV